jgi:hypothetical protein
VKEAIAQGQSYSGAILAAAIVDVGITQKRAASVTVKWLDKGYKITSRAGDLVYESTGGEGYYILALSWLHKAWTVDQIITVHV